MTCPFYEIQKDENNLTYCSEIHWCCPFFGDNRECGTYNSIVKHSKLRDEITALQRKTKSDLTVVLSADLSIANQNVHSRDGSIRKDELPLAKGMTRPDKYHSQNPGGMR